MDAKTKKIEKQRDAYEAACTALRPRTSIINNASLMEASLTITNDPCTDLRIADTALELAILAKQRELDILRIAKLGTEAALADCELNQDPGQPPPVDP